MKNKPEQQNRLPAEFNHDAFTAEFEVLARKHGLKNVVVIGRSESPPDEDGEPNYRLVMSGLGDESVNLSNVAMTFGTLQERLMNRLADDVKHGRKLARS